MPEKFNNINGDFLGINLVFIIILVLMLFDFTSSSTILLTTMLGIFLFYIEHYIRTGSYMMTNDQKIGYKVTKHPVHVRRNGQDTINTQHYLDNPGEIQRVHKDRTKAWYAPQTLFGRQPRVTYSDAPVEYKLQHKYLPRYEQEDTQRYRDAPELEWLDDRFRYNQIADMMGMEVYLA